MSDVARPVDRLGLMPSGITEEPEIGQDKDRSARSVLD